MFQLDRLNSAETLFFSFFEIDQPTELYQIYDKRRYYWTAKEEGQHIHIKYALDEGNRRDYDTDMIHRYRKNKGDFYERDDFAMFKVTYSIKEIDYTYFKVFCNDLYIDDYDNFLERMLSVAAQS